MYAENMEHISALYITGSIFSASTQQTRCGVPSRPRINRTVEVLRARSNKLLPSQSLAYRLLLYLGLGGFPSVRASSERGTGE